MQFDKLETDKVIQQNKKLVNKGKKKARQPEKLITADDVERHLMKIFMPFGRR